MPVSMPPTTSSQGKKVVVFLTTPPAAASGIPTVAEVNAGLFSSLHIYGTFNVTPNQNTGEGPRKLGSRRVPSKLGTINYPALEVQYSYMPQELGTPGSDGNEVYELLDPDVIVTAVVLDGLDGEETSAVVAGDVADIYKVQAGVRRKGDTGEGEFDEKAVMQNLIVVGGVPIKEDHVLAAA